MLNVAIGSAINCDIIRSILSENVYNQLSTLI